MNHEGIGKDRLDSSNEVGEKREQIVISFVKRKPGNWLFDLLQPSGHQSRLAVASRSRDQMGELVLQPTIKLVEEVGTPDQIGREDWPLQFRAN